ncbi:MAG: TetR/AcrR family transcriptional regulator [Bacteroidota bacterium]
MSEASSPKREQVLRTGRELFWKFGFRRVTIEEICREAGVSKMTYYKHFTNKTDLVKTIMEGALKESLKKYRAIIDSKVPYPEKVVQMVELKREQVEHMSNEFFRDYMQSDDPEMVSFLHLMAEENLKMIADDFRKAQKKGDIRKDLKVEFLMYIMNHMIEMTHDPQLLDMYPDSRELVMEITNFLFYGILDREEHR